MSSSFDLDEVDSFICAAIGRPGERVFYLQAIAGTLIVAVKLEKQQVGLLADYLERLIDSQELPDGPDPKPGELSMPILPEWVVGSMMVAINDAAGRVIVIAQEITENADDAEAEPEELIEPDDESELGQLRVALTRNQVVDFIEQARDLMAGGRPTCRLCGRPMDPEGHVCPRWN